jgi:hypothetical protein
MGKPRRLRFTSPMPGCCLSTCKPDPGMASAVDTVRGTFITALGKPTS